MSNYTERLVVTVPASLADVAAKVGRAMDPDTGGERSFTAVEGTDVLVCSTPCVPEFKQAAVFMLSDPVLLQQSCSLDYAARWPEHTPPTLQECEAFCASVILDNGVSEAVEGLE